MSKVSEVISFKRRRTPHERFAALMEPHFDALYGAARRMTLSPAGAADLVQAVCIKAFICLDKLEQVEYPRAWLMQVMYNRFVDDAR